MPAVLEYPREVIFTEPVGAGDDCIKNTAKSQSLVCGQSRAEAIWLNIVPIWTPNLGPILCEHPVAECEAGDYAQQCWEDGFDYASPWQWGFYHEELTHIQATQPLADSVVENEGPQEADH